MKVGKKSFICMIIVIILSSVLLFTYIIESGTEYHKSGDLRSITISPEKVMFIVEGEKIVLHINSSQFLLDYAEQAEELKIDEYFWDIWGYMSFVYIDTEICYTRAWLGLGYDTLISWSVTNEK